MSVYFSQNYDSNGEYDGADILLDGEIVGVCQPCIGLRDRDEVIFAQLSYGRERDFSEAEGYEGVERWVEKCLTLEGS
jgi:hypothetical protein